MLADAPGVLDLYLWLVWKTWSLNSSTVRIPLFSTGGLADQLLGRGEAEAIALALTKKAQLLAIDDKNGINACKLLSIPFTTAVGILIRSREMRLINTSEALEKLAALAKHGRYKGLIIEDARRKLEVTS